MTDTSYIGGKITVPGLYSRMSMNAYHRGDICDGPSISSSGLRKIIQESEADYWDTSPLNPQRNPIADKEKRAFVLGRGVHHLALGEPYFTKLFVEQPSEYITVERGKTITKPWNGNAGVCKKWQAEQIATGRSALTVGEIEQVRGMMLSLYRYPLIRAGILNGRIERSGFFKDKTTGVWLKIRPDVVPNDSDDVVDLKTTQSVKWVDLQRTIEDYGYHQQAALMAWGWRALFGREINSFSLVFIQSKRPHSVRVVTLEPEDIARGHALNEQALDRFVSGLKSGEWPGPGGFQKDAHSIALSDRARERLDNQIKYGAIN